MTRPSSPPPPVVAPLEPDQLPADTPRVLAGFLVSYENQEAGVYYPIYQGRNVVGRAGAVEGLNVEIDHPTTSSQHAVIFAAARPGRMKLEDLRSTNGTFLAGQKLSCETKHELKDGTEIRFGGYPVTVKIV